MAAWPKTKEQLQEAGYVFDNEAKCRACEAEIEWWITPNGKKMPMVVVQQRENGTPNSAMVFVRNPHWADCPIAKDFKR